MTEHPFASRSGRCTGLARIGFGCIAWVSQYCGYIHPVCKAGPSSASRSRSTHFATSRCAALTIGGIDKFASRRRAQTGMIQLAVAARIARMTNANMTAQSRNWPAQPIRAPIRSPMSPTISEPISTSVLGARARKVKPRGENAAGIDRRRLLERHHARRAAGRAGYLIVPVAQQRCGVAGIIPCTNHVARQDRIADRHRG